MVEISVLQEATEAHLIQLNALLRQLRSNPDDHRPVSMELLNEVLQASNTRIFVVLDGEKIVGTATIVWNQILTDRFAFVEDVVVDEKYRGQGLGEKLVRELIKVAKQNHVETIALTSRPTRIAANKLYPKLGFRLKETNYYELDL